MATNSPCATPQSGLLDRGIEAAIGQAERHRRVVKRDRHRLCRVHPRPLQFGGWLSALEG